MGDKEFCWKQNYTANALAQWTTTQVLLYDLGPVIVTLKMILLHVSQKDWVHVNAYSLIILPTIVVILL